LDLHFQGMAAARSDAPAVVSLGPGDRRPMATFHPPEAEAQCDRPTNGSAARHARPGSAAPIAPPTARSRPARSLAIALI
jgi:hypothetical protein